MRPNAPRKFEKVYITPLKQFLKNWIVINFIAEKLLLDASVKSDICFCNQIVSLCDPAPSNIWQNAGAHKDNFDTLG